MKIAAPHAAVKDSYRWSPGVKDERKFSSADSGFFVTVATEIYDNVTKFIKDSER
jgi:hypothetical protein